MELFRVVLNSIYDDFFDGIVKEPLFKSFFQEKDVPSIKKTDKGNYYRLFSRF